MRATVRLIGPDGNVLEGEVELKPVGSSRSVRRKNAKSSPAAGRSPKSTHDKFDFSKPERAFFKTHARNLSGPKKFVLMLAYLAKGLTGTEVALRDIEKHWNKMTSHLGVKFNRFYSTSAKDNGWVDTPKTGAYVLCPSWREAF